MTELERRAMLGDKQAQEECTKKGIVLPCPFCGEEGIIKTSISMYGKSYAVRCENKCAVTCGNFRISGVEWRTTTEKEALAKWNTRQAPPIGRCGECVYSTVPDENGILFCENLSVGTERNGFCSDFQQEEREE